MQLIIDSDAFLQIHYVVSRLGVSVETAVLPWLRTSVNVIAIRN